MSWAVHIDHELRTVFVTFDGVVSDADLQAAQERLLGAPDFDPTYNRLIVVSNAAAATLSGSCLRATAARTRLEGPAKCAIVAPADVDYGLGRLYEMSAGEKSNRIAVFRDTSEARAWLGLRTNLRGRERHNSHAD